MKLYTATRVQVLNGSVQEKENITFVPDKIEFFRQHNAADGEYVSVHFTSGNMFRVAMRDFLELQRLMQAEENRRVSEDG